MATIFESIKAGDIDAVRAAVKDDPSVAAARDDDGRSAVRAALYIHNQKLADVLLRPTPSSTCSTPPPPATSTASPSCSTATPT